MLQKHVSLFLLFLLPLFVLLLLRWFAATYEGFQNQQDAASVLQQAQPFFDFHGKVCDTWNQVIEAAMKSDQTSLTQEQYTQQLEAKQTPPATFVRCDTPLTASTDLQTLATHIPTLQVYQATLGFLNTEIQKIQDQTTAALQGQSQQGFADLPPSFQAPFRCTTSSNGLLQCTTQLTAVQPAAADASGSAAANQAQLLQQVQQQIQPILAALPTLQVQLQTATAGLQKLNDYKQKAESGELVNEIKIPS